MPRDAAVHIEDLETPALHVCSDEAAREWQPASMEKAAVDAERAFAGFAMLLVVIGLYGMLAYAAESLTREVGYPGRAGYAAERGRPADRKRPRP